MAEGDDRAAATAVARRGGLTKGQRTRLRIFNAALALFGTRGFAGVSLRDIAAEVGVTHVTVLHYFASKDELLIELMLHRDEIERAAVKEFLAGDHEAHDEARGLHAPGLRWFMHRLQRNADEAGAAPLFLKISTEATDAQHPAHQHFVSRYEFVIARLAEAFAEEFALHPDREFVPPETAARHLVAIADGAQLQSIYRARPTQVVEDAWEYLGLLGLPLTPPAS